MNSYPRIQEAKFRVQKNTATNMILTISGSRSYFPYPGRLVATTYVLWLVRIPRLTPCHSIIGDMVLSAPVCPGLPIRSIVDHLGQETYLMENGIGRIAGGNCTLNSLPLLYNCALSHLILCLELEH